jgi:hypothetical protein
VYAPPATVLLHDLQFQIPTECLLTVVFPQKVQTYLACWVISIFFTCFRREAPYLEGSNRQSLISYSSDLQSGLSASQIESEFEGGAFEKRDGLRLSHCALAVWKSNVPGTIFTGNSDLLGSLGHLG